MQPIIRCMHMNWHDMQNIDGLNFRVTIKKLSYFHFKNIWHESRVAGYRGMHYIHANSVQCLHQFHKPTRPVLTEHLHKILIPIYQSHFHLRLHFIKQICTQNQVTKAQFVHKQYNTTHACLIKLKQRLRKNYCIVQNYQWSWSRLINLFMTCT